MYLNFLHIEYFKGVENLEFSLSKGFTLFHGLNGVGKTNVLDAIWFAGCAKSYFNLAESQLVHQDSGYSRIEARFVHSDEHHVKMAWYKGKKKAIEVNGDAVSKSKDLLGRFPLVMIFPGDVELIYGHSDTRRKFIDRTFSTIDSEYLNALVSYHRLLDQRNKHLKSGKDGKTIDEKLLLVLTEQMAPHAAVIISKRESYLSELISYALSVYQVLAKSSDDIDARYLIHTQGDKFTDQHLQNIQHDIILKRTNSGPHKDDVEFRLGDMPLKKVASQGQIKSVLISIKLAQWFLFEKYTSIKPIILLDDIFEKLDLERSKELFQWLDDSDVEQIMITDTEKERGKIALSKCGKPQNFIHIRRT